MKFDLSPEQQDFVAVLRGRLARDGMQAAREVADPAPAARAVVASAWRDLVADLDLAAVGQPEEAGGTGLGVLEQCLIAEELGRVAHPAPYQAMIGWSSALLREAATSQALDLLSQVVAGKSLTVAPIGTDVPPSLRHSGGGAVVVDGEIRNVMGSWATDLLVPFLAGSHGAVLLVRVPAQASGVHWTPVPSVDAGRDVCDIALASTPGTVLGEVGADDWQRALSCARLVLAAEQVGLADAALDMAREYAGQRQAFGRPIGAFQSVKHALVDVFLDVDAARSAVRFAAWVTDADRDEGSDEVDDAVDVAVVAAAGAARAATQACVQVHGALGFTWEHDAHLLLRRAIAVRHSMGHPMHARRRMADRLLGTDLG